MRELWAREDYFTFEGKFFGMRDVILYTKPKAKIPIYFSATGPKSASYAGKFGDHLITFASPETCRDVIFPKFNEATSAAGKDPRKAEKMILVNFALGDPKESIKRLKHGWAGFLAKGAFDEPDPRRVEASASSVDDDVIREWFQLCPTVEHLAEVAERYREAGANQVVFETGPSPELIRSIPQEVLPRLR